MRDWLTLYTDGEVHDGVSPKEASRSGCLERNPSAGRAAADCRSRPNTTFAAFQLRRRRQRVPKGSREHLGLFGPVTGVTRILPRCTGPEVISGVTRAGTLRHLRGDADGLAKFSQSSATRSAPAAVEREGNSRPLTAIVQWSPLS